MNENKIIPLSIPIVLAHSLDEPFALRLMANPEAGLAWAEAALRGADKDEWRVAAACCLAHDASWSEQAVLAAHHVRMAGLAHKAMAPLFLSALPGVWSLEQSLRASKPGESWGVQAMIKSMTDIAQFGVASDVAQSLAKLVMDDQGVALALDAMTMEEVSNLLERAAANVSVAPSAWQEHLAIRMDAPACLAKLCHTYFRKFPLGAALLGRGSILQSPTRGACFILARNALSEPKTAYILLHSILMGGVRSRPEGEEGLAGAFDALATHPRPTLAGLDARSTAKLYTSSRGPVSIATQLMCLGQFEAGLAAAGWAKALGGAGREPARLLTDGLSQAHIDCSLRYFDGRSGGGLNLSISSMIEPAIVLKRADVCARLVSMGWSRPSKSSVAALIKAVADAGKAAKAMNLTGRFDQSDDPIDAAAGIEAFWSALEIERSLDGGRTGPTESLGRKAPRI